LLGYRLACFQFGPGVDNLVEYETRFHYLFPKYDYPVACTYQLPKFGATVKMDILRTPVVIIGGVPGEPVIRSTGTVFP
jgi:hypothetical protein